MAFSFDFDTWRENMPLQLLDYAKDENVRAVLVVIYRNVEEEDFDTVDLMIGAEQDVSSFLLLGMLEDAKFIVHGRNVEQEE